jgi:hypothetical protein
MVDGTTSVPVDGTVKADSTGIPASTAAASKVADSTALPRFMVAAGSTAEAAFTAEATAEVIGNLEIILLSHSNGWQASLPAVLFCPHPKTI